MKSFIGTTVFALVALVVVACDGSGDDLTGRRGANGANGANSDGTNAGENGAEGAGDPTQPGSCKEGAPHPGFANNDFVADRKPGAIGAERRRVKPFSVLRTEMQRAIGAIPASMAGNVSAYGIVPARWYAEPAAGAVSLFTTYGVAFTGCYDSMSDAKFMTAPTAELATAECTRMQRKFWQRSPTPEETMECAELATSDLATEPVPRRRWAHACASLMTSASFTTY